MNHCKAIAENTDRLKHPIQATLRSSGWVERIVGIKPTLDVQRVSPDMEATDIIRLESSWKDRLHTREFGMNEK